MWKRMGRVGKRGRRWFFKRERRPDATWKASRLARVRFAVNRRLRAIGKWLPATPAWLAKPIDRTKLLSYGRWRFFRIAYWVTLGRYLLYRCFGNPYGRAGTGATALMAVFCFLCVGGAIYGGLKYGVNSRTISLKSAYQAAIERNDLDSAASALEALLENVPQSPEYRYQQALLDLQRGNTTSARNSMRSLALNDRQEGAVRWLLVNDFDLANVSHWSAEQHGNFRSLADQVMSHENGDIARDGKLQMSKYLLASGAASDALRLLTELSSEHPPAALVAATICLQQGRIADARSHALVAKEYFSKQLLTNREDSKTRLDLARALVVLGEEEQALRELSEGFKATEGPQLRVASAEAMVIWANRLGAQPEQTNRTLLQRLQLLHRASQCAPQDPHINAAIIGLVLECKDNKNKEVAALRQATAQGIDPESVHFARGTLALLEGRTEEAQTHLAQAAQRGTQLPATLNNMAMAIYQSVDGDMELALRLADQAVELLPKHPYLNDTRGRILLKLKRFPEAIASLEKGLLATELQPEIYANLATAYRQLGDTAMAHEMEEMLAQADVSN